MSESDRRTKNDLQPWLIVAAVAAIFFFLTVINPSTHSKPIIENQGFPYAGEQFRFTVAGTTGKTKIEVYIDTARIFEEDCPDEPCHEVIRIPEKTEAALLRIIARDSHGNTTERKFTISRGNTSPMR